MSETETSPRPSKRGLKTGLEPKTGLEYYNTTGVCSFIDMIIALLIHYYHTD